VKSFSDLSFLRWRVVTFVPFSTVLTLPSEILPRFSIIYTFFLSGWVFLPRGVLSVYSDAMTLTDTSNLRLKAFLPLTEASTHSLTSPEYS